MMGRIVRMCGGMAMGLAAASVARAGPAAFESLPPLSLMQVVNPADKGYKPEAPPPEAPAKQHVGTWEMPPVKVVGEKASELREEDRIGSYEQPRWTADRRFPGDADVRHPGGEGGV